MTIQRVLSKKTRFLNSLRALLMFPFAERLLVALKGNDNVFVKFLPNHYQYRPQTFRTFSRNGIKFKVDISDWMGYAAYFKMTLEWHETLFSLVKPDMVVFDIGANLGYTALNMALLVKDSGCVYAFEPDAYNYHVLSGNLLLNPTVKNIRTFQLGLGNSTAKLKLLIQEGNRGTNKITDSETAGNYELVDIVKLDDFVKDKHVPKIDLIKIDTEGFETNILKGAEETLKRNMPVLFIEVNNDHLIAQHSSAKDLITYLKSLGYEITADRTGKVVNPTDDLNNCHFDIICKART